AWSFIRSARHKGLLSTVCQELSRQHRRAIGGLDDFPQILPRLSLRGKMVSDALRVAEDHREQIVEVMRNPAGKPADRLELRRMAELLFERLHLAADAMTLRRFPRVDDRQATAIFVD